ncbi:DUF427 domain-containing protein [candidate division KSB1 bacterium]|nr:DUF427 domain-containing protein [candidate division KSB1 bacterium]
MPKASWNGKVIAESDKTEVMEGSYYFPPDSIKKEYFKESKTETVSPRIGTARYYHVDVEGKVNVDAAWYYPRPKKAAKHIKGYVAFWRGVEVHE